MPARSNSAKRRTKAPLLLRIALAALLACTAAAPIGTAFADGESAAEHFQELEAQLLPGWDQVGNMNSRYGLDPEYARSSSGVMAMGLDSALPETYDLRDLGQSTSVKMQSPWGTCWAFSAVAAAESSLLKQGIGTAETTDLSERHLSWFNGCAVTEEETKSLISNQSGEGVVVTGEGLSPLDAAGGIYSAMALLASGQGLIEEDKAPYRNDEGILVNKTDGEGNPVEYYSKDGTWSVSSSLRFASDYQLVNTQVLPSPTSYTLNEKGEPDSYSYDPSVTATAKQLLMETGALDLGYAADANRPEDQTQNSTYFNYTNWAQYTCDYQLSNHGVTIVGWDDTYSKENFVNESGELPEQDGAWIVKNDWGSKDGDVGNKRTWGIDGSGYFYLSYYDRTIESMISYQMVSKQSDEYYDKVLQYDIVGQSQPFSSLYSVLQSYGKTSVANIFPADEDIALEAVSAATSRPGTNVEVEVYLLNEGATSPLDGTIVATAQACPENAGYTRIALDAAVQIQAGQRFSVVETHSAIDSQAGPVYDLPLERGMTAELAASLGFKSYTSVVANEGESFVIDDTVMDITEIPVNSGLVLGNAEIKAFVKSTPSDQTPGVEPDDPAQGTTPAEPIVPATPTENGQSTKQAAGESAPKALAETGDTQPLVPIAAAAALACALAMGAAFRQRRQ